MTKKKGKVLTFLFALIPGAGQMYLGFMKRGLSLILYAVAVLLIPIIFYEPAALILFPPVWMYAFFDALNLNGCSDEAFAQIKDEYVTFDFLEGFNKQVFDGKNKVFVGKSLVFVGTFFFAYNALSSIRYMFPNEQWYWISEYIDRILNRAPRFVVAILLIVIGKSLVRGRKEDVNTVSFEEFEAIKDKAEDEDE